MSLSNLAEKHPPVWLWLSDRFEGAGDVQCAKDYTRRYLEAGGPQRITAWERLAELCRKTGDVIGEINALVGMSESVQADVRVISRAANRVNALFRDKSLPVDSEEKRLLVEKLIKLFEQKILLADATDLSRLAWLQLCTDDEDGARTNVRKGLSIDSENPYLRNLAKKLNIAF